MPLLNEWQKYSVLQEVLSEHNLLESKLGFVLHNTNHVEGTLIRYVFEEENVFLTLQDVSINQDSLPEFTVNGLEIVRWNISKLSEQAKKKANQQDNNGGHCDNSSKVNIPSSASNSKILIDNSVFMANKSEGEQLTYHYKEIDLDQDDNHITIDLSCLHLPASNNVELIKLKSIYSGAELEHYYQKCDQIVHLLLQEQQIGFAMFPINNNVQWVLVENTDSRRNIMQDVNVDVLYLVFSTASTNYAFYLQNSGDSFNEPVHFKAAEKLKKILESGHTQKVMYRCSIISGILWNLYGINLRNVCDLQLMDWQVQRIRQSINFRKQRLAKLTTYIQMVHHYLGIEVAPLDHEVTNWTHYSAKVTNTIRLNVIFLRELCTRMNYEMMHQLFVYSDRCLSSLRSSSEKELNALATIETQKFYSKLLSQPLFDQERTAFRAEQWTKHYPLLYYEPASLMQTKPTKSHYHHHHHH